MVYIILGLFFIAAIMDAFTEAIQHNYTSVKARFPKMNDNYWNPNISHKNKWKLDNNGSIIYKNGKKVERYFGSSTFLVRFTDAYHMLRSIQKACYIISIPIALFIVIGLKELIVVSIVTAFIYYLTFHFMYNYLHEIKKEN